MDATKAGTPRKLERMSSRGLLRFCRLLVGNAFRSQGLELDQVFVEQQIQRPIQRDAELLFEARQFAEVNRPPHPPRNEPGELEPKHLRHARAAPDAHGLLHLEAVEALQGPELIVPVTPYGVYRIAVVAGQDLYCPRVIGPVDGGQIM